MTILGRTVIYLLVTHHYFWGSAGFSACFGAAFLAGAFLAAGFLASLGSFEEALTFGRAGSSFSRRAFRRVISLSFISISSPWLRMVVSRVVVINSKNENNISTRTQLEVDFVATKGSKKYYIQSAYKLYDESKVEQERRSLINIDDSFKKIIVVRDPIKVMHDEYGITSIGIVEFLSNVNSMDL